MTIFQFQVDLNMWNNSADAVTEKCDIEKEHVNNQVRIVIWTLKYKKLLENNSIWL